MKKYLKIFLVIFIIIVAIIVGYIIYNNNTYSLDEIIASIEPENKLPNNLFIKEETFQEDSVNTKYTYIKDNMVYIFLENSNKEKIEEDFYDFNNKEKVHIMYDLSKVNISPIDESESLYYPTSYSFCETLKNSDNKYKYLGNEHGDNGVNYIKFSLSNDEGEVVYYINKLDNNISKIEAYSENNNDLELTTKTEYTYSYDIVKDEDILRFDANNYPNFTIENFVEKTVM